jgi:hypothetical protein
MSGILKVVLPFPAPNDVPTTENSALKVALLTAAPSHSSQPEGELEPPNIIIDPVGAPDGP